MSRTPIRLTAALFGASAMVFAAAIPASAHVVVNDPAEVSVGTYPTLTFMVPNEREATQTKKLQIKIPTEGAGKLTNALAKRVPGWKHKIEKQGGGDIGQGVTSVTWTADSKSTIPAGDFEQFALTVGSVPDTDRIYFDAIQTYTDGEVVRWDEKPTSENPEPAHPAPSVAVAQSAEGSKAENAAARQTVPLGGTHSQASEDSSASPAMITGTSAAAVLAGAGGLMWMRQRARRTSGTAD